MPGKNGGARPGAGRKKGGKNLSTLTREDRRVTELNILHDLLADELTPIVKAQIGAAKGVSYMRLRTPDGKFATARDEKQIDAAIAAGASWFEITTQAPSVPAFDALMNRAYGKATERHEITGAEGGPLVVKWDE